LEEVYPENGNSSSCRFVIIRPPIFFTESLKLGKNIEDSGGGKNDIQALAVDFSFGAHGLLV